MNEAQKKVLELLSELHQLLEESQVRYCAADKLAWDCLRHGKFNGGNYRVGLLMAPDAIQALGSIEWPANRSVRIVRDADGEVTRARYIAEDTTLLSVDSPDQSAPGISVMLLPVRQEGAAFQTGTCHGQVLRLWFDPLKDCPLAAFETIQLRLPSDAKRYLKRLLGNKWDKYKLPTELPRYGTVIDVDTPYRQFVDEASEQGCYDPSIAVTAADYQRWRESQLDATAREVEQVTNRYKLLTQRFKLCEKYYPHKQKLLDAWAQGRKDEVARAMKDYTDQMVAFSRLGMTVYFDRDLYLLELKVMLHQKRYRALALPLMLRPRHVREPLSDMVKPYLVE